MKKLTILCLLFIGYRSLAQTCTAPGQTPPTAFPICGNSTFHQTTVPICSTQPALYVPGCTGDGADYRDKNPFWYKFTCYQSGSLGFLIAPLDLGDDYDWQLYDITGHDPNDVFTTPSLIVAANWVGTYGYTGASSTGVNFIQCASDPAQNLNAFAAMPNVIAGHTYLLLVSHYTNSQSGYDLSFSGGTAVITDTTQPNIKYTVATCGVDVITVKLNKKMRCSSIAADGSDFTFSGANVTVIGASGVNCSSTFDTDSVEVHLSGPLAPGNYTLNVQHGIDNNTILDFCDNEIPDGTSIAVTVSNLLAANFTSLDDVCPNEAVQFTSTAQGQIANYNWSFGDGTTSAQQSPSHIYSAPTFTTSYIVTLSVSGSGCQNSITKTIKVYSSCYLAVPSGFTPNHDGKNDTFHPLNAVKADNINFKVYNRWGQLVFQSQDWKEGWDGTFKGAPQPTGVYVWLLSYTDRDTKEQRQMKGTVALIR